MSDPRTYRMQNMVEREEDRLEAQYENGQIDAAEYREQLKDLYREAAESDRDTGEFGYGGWHN